jgi:hypothetical protein
VPTGSSLAVSPARERQRRESRRLDETIVFTQRRILDHDDFEETVVDRYGLWEYVPYYGVGRLCSSDIAAMIALGVLVWRAFRRGRIVSTS